MFICHRLIILIHHPGRDEPLNIKYLIYLALCTVVTSHGQDSYQATYWLLHAPLFYHHTRTAKPLVTQSRLNLFDVKIFNDCNPPHPYPIMFPWTRSVVYSVSSWLSSLIMSQTTPIKDDMTRVSHITSDILNNLTRSTVHTRLSSM